MGNVADVPTMTDEALTDRDARMRALQSRLHRYEVEIVGDTLTVLGQAADDGPRPKVTVQCRPWEVDGGVLWFWVGDEAIEPATHLVDTAMRIVARMGPTS